MDDRSGLRPDAVHLVNVKQKILPEAMIWNTTKLKNNCPFS